MSEKELSEDPQFQADSSVGDDFDFAEEALDEPRCENCSQYRSECECPLDEEERSYL